MDRGTDARRAIPEHHGNTIEDFRDLKTEVIVYPPEYKSGEAIYPAAKAVTK